nr:ribonuclease H-like domain-containing protein [Tanacetum cinerariifolium]
NKRPRAMALKAELHNLKLGDLSIDGYFQKIESIVLVLNDLGSPFSNDDVFTFALEGLPSTYETISTVIHKYAMEILERAYMVGCNPSRTLVDTESKLGDGGTPVVDRTLYRSLASSLQYLTFTRPDITYAVQQ